MQPKILKADTVLCVAAHYDDEALFFGGTLLRLAHLGCGIYIVVLTDVAETNPPATLEQKAREPRRQRCRLKAFSAVCAELDAASHCLNLPQIANFRGGADERNSLLANAGLMLAGLVAEIRPDVILTHGRSGDYTAPKYCPGWRVARCQHAWANGMVHSLNRPKCFEVAQDGDVVVAISREGKLALLEHYRYGCTQEPEWDAMKNYPEWIGDEERFREMSQTEAAA